MNEQLQYVGALCARAIAQGWDSGRLSFPGNSGLPFASEVHAILSLAPGVAADELRRAEERVRDLEPRRAQAPQSGLSAALRALAVEFSLSALATDLLLLLCAPSLWGELARLYGIIANDPARPLCDELLLGQILLVPPDERPAIARQLDRDSPLLRHGLILQGAGRRPFAELSVDPILVRRLQGDRFERSEPESGVTLRAPERPLADLTLPEGLAESLLRCLQDPPTTPLRLVLRGRAGSGRGALLAALAERCGRRLGSIDLETLDPTGRGFPERLRVALRQTMLRGWLPCVSGLGRIAAADADARTTASAVLARHPGPLLLRCEPEARPPLPAGYALFDLPPLSEGQRAASFRAELERHHLPPGAADALAAKYRVGPALIARVTAQVATGAAHEHGAPDDAQTEVLLEAALRQHREEQVGAVATRVTRLASWDNVVLPEEVLDSVYEFIGRLRHRRLVYESWGMDRILTSARGLTALFEGGPGTGKTLVAGLIARELGYDLYRVDLSRVLSKWIGETEQNLAKVFDAIEDGQAILLFDEADALFAKRTEVRASVDRYANAEVNYLLQRLDTFEGIAVLTTNFGKAIDPAFKRRLSLRLTFPFPDEQMRLQLWRAHLPPELPLGEDLDLEALAARYEISGGYIRNAVLRAAFLAAQDQSALLQEHLERAVRLEYREVGKLFEGGVLE